jgi:hypothetical protein
MFLQNKNNNQTLLSQLFKHKDREKQRKDIKDAKLYLQIRIKPERLP